MNKKIQIVPYSKQFRSSFKELNIWWVKKYFSVEPIDLKYLENPEENIIAQGGFIYLALLNGKPVGACALMKTDSDGLVYELSKMGILPEAQGLKIGLQLAETVIKKAKSEGAEKIYLESNTVLKPAINLYRKLGFVEIPNFESPYKRSNIAMELVFKK